MKKLFYLAVILCFVQVGISKAQTVVTNEQKKEQISNMQTGQTPTNTVTADKQKVETPTGSCSKTVGTPSCCQNKSASSCGSGANTVSATKTDKKKTEANKTASNRTPLVGTPK